MADGARDALLGYLYQFIGVASLRASATTCDATGLSAVFLGRVANGRLVHEAYGQDAVVRRMGGGSGNSVLVQFKHSDDATNQIGADEFRDILWKLDRSRVSAATHGETVDSCVLITNRKLAPDAEALYASRTGAKRPSGLKQKKTYRRKPTQKARKVLKDYPSLDAAASAWFEVLKVLVVFQQRAVQRGLKDLKAFAAQHGVTDDELPNKLAQTLGALLTETADRELDINESWLRRHLVGADDAQSLVFKPGSVLDDANDAVAERLGRQTGLGHARLVRRDLLDRLHMESTRTPVVFVLGEGGCGKSVLALQYLGEQGVRLLAIPLTADDASEEEVLDAIARLRSRTRQLPRDISLNVAVRRLRGANATSARVMLVNLDGLEEPYYSPLMTVKRLVTACWAQGLSTISPVGLLISCRPREGGSEADISDLISRLFDCEDPSILRDQVGLVIVTDFDENELLEAAQALGGDASERLANHLLGHLGGAAADGTLPTGSSAISESVVSSLKHPVVWEEFAKLGDTDRVNALTGEPSALKRLADGLLARFGRKCRARRHSLVSDSIIAALEGVANVTAAMRPPYSRRNHWLPGAGHTLSPPEAELLFTEATTYGLVRCESPDEWRWRHAFVTARLRRGDPS